MRFYLPVNYNMKKIVFIILLMVCFGCGHKDNVYICTGGSSARYHESSHCRGLSNCRGEVERIKLIEAQDMGRTPCRICY